MLRDLLREPAGGPGLHGQPLQLGPRGERLFDVLLAGTLVLPLLVFPVAGIPWRDTLLCTAQLVPLFWRRRHATAVFVVVALAHAAQVLLTAHALYGQVSFPIAVYSVARHASTRAGLAAAGVGFVGSALASYDWLRPFDMDFGGYVAYFLTMATIVVSAWALGTLGRTRRAYVDALLERGRRLELEAAQQAELAARDERARIAREMHDVVAHGLSVIVVQADGARYAAARTPEVATEALARISETGRDALTEMRRMLGLLRTDGETGTAPQPGLADVESLIADAREGGLAVDAVLETDRPVPDGIGLTGYRIVQEALTNVRKHAGADVRVQVRVLVGDALTVEVLDDGRGPAGGSAGGSTGGSTGGLGLLGMRERVVVHGGTLEAGPRRGGGFAVSARIPL